MNFWQRVDSLLSYKNMTRKALASDAGFDVSNIGKGISNNNIPAADTAVKIAKILGTTVEYLVTGEDHSISDEAFKHLDKFYKYSKVFQNLENIPDEKLSSVEFIINEFSNSYKGEKGKTPGKMPENKN